MAKIKHKNLIFLILIIACVAVVSGCIKKQENKQVVENNNKQIIEEYVDISDWQTYRNEEYGFELQYPKDWKIGENEHLREGKLQQVVVVYSPNGEYRAVDLLISKGESSRKREDDTLSVIFLDDIFIGGYKTNIAYKEDNLNQWSYSFFIRSENENLQFSFSPSEHVSKEILYKILDTVKFLD
ncbi:MAG: PsbP-related protein [Candidatus Falkowbacteria bacterium]